MSSIELRQYSFPTKRVRFVPHRDEPLATIAGFAFRYSVTTPREDLPDGKVELFTLPPASITIVDATALLVDIVFAVAQTAFVPDFYRGELRARSDGTDPQFPILPDHFMPLDYLIFPPEENT